jgi:hopanoid biosynthesis associated RND transporter like protein HpnN
LNDYVERWLAQLVSDCVRSACRFAWPIIVVCALLTLGFGVYTAQNFGVNSDLVRNVAVDLPSRQNYEAFAEVFPNLENALLVVVDAETPELARDAASRLEEQMLARPEVFEDAYETGASDFFEIHGLLYRSVDELDLFADQMARLQPLLAELERDPGIETLTRSISDGLDALRDGEGDLDPAEWSRILDSLGHATIEVYNEFPLAVSWEEMMLADSAIETSVRRVLVVQPILDFTKLMPAGPALDEIRAIARGLQLSPERGVTVRITGNPALNYEELIGFAWDIGLGGVVCFFIVAGVLARAFRSLRLVAAAVIVLLTGLVWTAAFATLAVGDLSIVSLAVGVLFIGLGVDFAIHLGMAYADLLRAGADHETAMVEAAIAVGPSLGICTVTTAIGFYVFVPADFTGVAELGLIAGTGMFVIFGLTLTLFPALLSVVFRIDPGRELGSPLRFRSKWWRFDRKASGIVLSVAVAAGIAGIALLPQARFDSNVIKMRDPTTESVQAFDDLLAQSGVASPWFVNSVMPDLDSADALARRMDELDVVEHTITLSDFVPEDQDEKLEILEDLSFLLEAPPGLDEPPAGGGDVDAEIEALRRLHAFLGEAWLEDNELEVSPSALALRDKLGRFLARIDEEDDKQRALDALADVLLSGLPDQLDRLRRAANADEVTLDELPEDLVARMLTADGRARVQTFPAEDLDDEAAFERFTEAVLEVDPRAAGIPINLVGFSQAIRDSFREALIAAFAIIATLLVALWRRILPPIYVITPLLLSSLLTVAAMVLLDIPFNFANVIVIPLLLGIGVDSGIHLVHRASHDPDADLLDSTTARAVFYSALTTTVSFGTLAFSSHRGLATLGQTLAIGMVLTVLCNLIVLPSMIARFGGLAVRGDESDA